MAEWPETARLLEATMRHGYSMSLEGTMADLACDLDTALHDFLDWEANQPERWEFMTGGTGAHSLMKVVTPDRNVFLSRPVRPHSGGGSALPVHSR